jgi:hypothetical protein
VTQSFGAPAAPEPDDKDWTWVLNRVCPECEYDPSTVDRELISADLLATTPRWQAALAREEAPARPSPDVWSVVEYACHVRDVHRLFRLRAQLILDENDPEFANWDQDETAIADRYWAADPAVVADELDHAAAAAALIFSGLSDEQWARTGRRSNGSTFTTQTLGLYYLHDVVHHLHDVGA